MAKILVVEDEGILAMALCRNLEHAGHVVCRPAASAEQAVRSAAQEQPDLILMDIRLAGPLNGIEAAQQIRSFSSAPIIFMTGYSDANTRDQAMVFGPAAYLVKPIYMHHLAPLFRTLLIGGSDQNGLSR